MAAGLRVNWSAETGDIVIATARDSGPATSPRSLEMIAALVR